jgi:hypothetical protein
MRKLHAFLVKYTIVIEYLKIMLFHYNLELITAAKSFIVYAYVVSS